MRRKQGLVSATPSVAWSDDQRLIHIAHRIVAGEAGGLFVHQEVFVFVQIQGVGAFAVGIALDGEQGIVEVLIRLSREVAADTTMFPFGRTKSISPLFSVPPVALLSS
ncbi:MAG: hypothetical protein ACLS8R_06745 [Anaeromassilibacillus sp.]